MATLGAVPDCCSPARFTLTGIPGQYSSSARVEFNEMKNFGKPSAFRQLRLASSDNQAAAATTNLARRTLLTGTNRRGLIDSDISKGKETVRIPVYNTFNIQRIPEDFTYIRESVLKTEGAKALAEAGRLAMAHGNLPLCSIAHHGGSGPYNNERQLLCTIGEGVLECAEECQGRACKGTRVVSQGITLPLQIFHTGTQRGWGVRCAQGIAPGTFIACYAGEGITDSEAEKLTTSDAYLYDLSHFLEVRRDPAEHEAPNDINLSRTPPVPTDCLKVYLDNYSYFLHGAQPQNRGASSPMRSPQKAGGHEGRGSAEGESHLTLDARRAGNVARFVNHCCEPNCQMQSVLVAGDSALWHHTALFAITNIGPNQELTYDYGYTLGAGSNELECRCGAPRCKGRLL
ncbi:hypothetical protein WJX73_000578 [Symbiochloris irregularis]|uniref:Uncharacterized protein n=1 Tax=Symbiochloris irregularis TaxID=706552 RepID=A0AAW1NVM1_9CHLO